MRPGALVLLLACLVHAPAVQGQVSTAELEELQIDLWPEYDQAAMLVMYRFRLKEGTSLAVPVTIPIPADVGEPHAVAWQDPNGSLLVAEFTRRVEGDRALILARLGSLEGQLEFYDEIRFEERERTFRFTWPGGIDVGSLWFQVQRPLGATDLRIEPPPGRQWEGQDGLRYARVDFGSQPPSATPSIEIAYEKEDSALTAGEQTQAAAPVTTSAPPASGATASGGDLPQWIVAVGGVIVGVLLGGLFASMRASRAPAVKEEPIADARPKGKSKSAIYCHECGTKGRRTDAYCMECGTRLATDRG